MNRRRRMKRLLLLPVLTMAMAAAGRAQGLNVINSSSTNLLKVTESGKVGISQIDPRAQLEVCGYNGILSTGTINSGDVLAPGAGPRFMWYPRTGAFRAGVAESNYWDDDGTASPRLAYYSIAMGYQTRATSSYAVAIGRQNYATGESSLALGAYCQATASYSTSIGFDSWATGPYSVCLGRGLASNGKEGAVLIGDNALFSRAYASTSNELTMRFSGGYRLWTSHIDSVSGVYMRGGTSGWNNYCDRNKKENFERIDFEELLAGIQNIPVTKWNYRGGDPSVKYIGPMAQDFYSAFQLGGTDSLGINSICMDGVTLAGVQALISRTDVLKNQAVQFSRLEKTLQIQNEEIHGLMGIRVENEALKTKVAGLEKALSEQNQALEAQRISIESLSAQFTAVVSMLKKVEMGGRELKFAGSLFENEAVVK
jgi:hypothetical protein